MVERLPTRTFSGELTIQVGDKRVELIEVGPAHTRGDVLVHVPGDHAVFTVAAAVDFNFAQVFLLRPIAGRLLTDADAQKIETAARAEMDDAVNYALASPLPAPEEATNHIFA